MGVENAGRVYNSSTEAGTDTKQVFGNMPPVSGGTVDEVKEKISARGKLWEMGLYAAINCVSPSEDIPPDSLGESVKVQIVEGHQPDRDGVGHPEGARKCGTPPDCGIAEAGTGQGVGGPEPAGDKQYYRWLAGPLGRND